MKQVYYNNVLKPLTSKIKKYKIASYDIETYNCIIGDREYTEFLLGGFIDDRGKYKSFINRKEMCKYIEEHTDKDTIVFATNNMFDYQALFSKQEDYKQYSPLLRGGRILISKYRGIQMYDTYNYVQLGVKELGEILKLKKGDYDVKTTQPLYYYENHKKEFKNLRLYNYRDCQITREFMIQFQEILNQLGGQLKSTIGSCAMDLYRRKFLKENIHKEYCINKTFENGETVKEFIFRGYRGGRTETFKRGDTDKRIDTEKIIKFEMNRNDKLKRQHKPIHKYRSYDFNSMYMDCMRGKFPKPSSAIMRENRYGHLDIKNILKYDGVSECEVVVPYMKYPILPTTINHKLCFPIGKYTDCFTNGELREHLKNNGKITKIFRQIYYTKQFSPFENWVNYIYGKRLEAQKKGNKVYDVVYKNIGVNLYGKFGTHKLSKFEMIDIQQTDNMIGVQVNDDDLDFTYRETPIECNQCYVFPIFSSHVTMKGRLKLWKELVKLIAIMCDTDSVFTDIKRKTTDKLGDMKLEHEIAILRPIKAKMYSYKSITKDKWIFKLKGGQLGKGEFTKEEDYNTAVKGNKLKQWKFLKMKESARGKSVPNERIEFTKTFTTREDKRVWIPDLFDSNMYQESQPIILGFKNLDELNNYFLDFK